MQNNKLTPNQKSKQNKTSPHAQAGSFVIHFFQAAFFHDIYLLQFEFKKLVSSGVH
jgi:hypothetical protein